jgi:glycosyltransferase involved in cell wall biosynthesis
MKILYFCNSLQNGGGIERVVSQKANFLAKEHHVYILTTKQPQKEYFFPLDSKIEHIDFSDIAKPKNIIFQRAVFKKAIKDIDPDIIIAVTGKESLLLPLWDRKIPKIKEMHFSKAFRKIQHQNASPLKHLFLKAIGYLEFQLFRLYDVVTPLTYEDAKEWGLDNAEVVYNFVTIDPKEVSKLDTKEVISVGRLDYQKGYDLLLKAWKRVCDANSEWRLSIYGDGRDREYLKSLAKELGIIDRVSFKGSVKDIEKAYQKSSIYVMSSRHEGFPLVLPEALSCGLPIVSFDCPCGPKEIIEDGKCGFLVPSGDIDALAERLLLLIEDTRLREEMAKEAKIRSKKFAKEQVLRRWTEVFEIAIKKHKK